ncbi:hypothetical protein J2X86_002445 [Acinetobacter lwoffii]|jgi:hypothetical protein|uniref:Uncharacterized protein n=1 Tax=Acinetobacter lwoffii TaxID=28090 RepID=A0AAW8LLG8_ACILW|nr:hypothetical protein [Acinetobacter lwoffii]MDR6630390.1 hypothetical protein [Acinetobacter lwoffii]
MIDLMMLYAFIVGMALLNWGLNRFALFRGLSAAFLKQRQRPGFQFFFNKHSTPYIKAMVWVALYVLLVGFAAGRLLYLANLWSWETAIVGLVLMSFLARERVHYITAIFVVTRVNQE